MTRCIYDIRKYILQCDVMHDNFRNGTCLALLYLTFPVIVRSFPLASNLYLYACRTVNIPAKARQPLRCVRSEPLRCSSRSCLHCIIIHNPTFSGIVPGSASMSNITPILNAFLEPRKTHCSLHPRTHFSVSDEFLKEAYSIVRMPFLCALFTGPTLLSFPPLLILIESLSV